MILRSLFLATFLLGHYFIFGQNIDLRGKWKFQLDPEDTGISQKWFSGDLIDSISLPGSTISEGKGEKPSIKTNWLASVGQSIYFRNPEYAPYRADSNFKVSFFLQPDTYYQGAAWYQKKVKVSSDMANKPLLLYFERCHWQSTVWIDNTEIGSMNALGTPHTFYIVKGLSDGDHVITVMMDNRLHDIDIGHNAHSVSDQSQGNWNGIVGDMYLATIPEYRIDSVKVVSDLNNRSVEVSFNVTNERKWEKGIVASINLFGNRYKMAVSEKTKTVKCIIPIPEDAEYWDEFNPYLYDMKIFLTGRDGLLDDRNIKIGLRSIANCNGVLTINGHPAFMRGTLNCASFPRTGYPSTDKAEWLREFSKCKNYGLNHIRFHSWCPPEAAFQAADELGLYLYVESSAWAGNIGSGNEIDSYVYDETDRILYNFGNHPSFCFISYGNQPSGPKNEEYLDRYVRYVKSVEKRMLVTSSSGWPQIEASDFQCVRGPRIQFWGNATESFINSKEPSSDYNWSDYCRNSRVPVISHETGQWCTFPNFREINEYSGPYKARNFEIFRDLLEKHGMGNLAESFFMASGKLQTLCYKADIEAALRTRNQGGYELLGLQDFSGQGSALVGPLDVFWNEKAYTSAREYREFQNSVVPLALMKKFIYTDKETFEADIQLANYYKEYKGVAVTWNIMDRNGNKIQEGSFPGGNYPIGNVLEVGKISVDLDSLSSPQQYRLEVAIKEFANHWDFWVYPSDVTLCRDDIHLTDTLDNEAVDILKKGGKVLLSVKKGKLNPDFGGNIPVGFSSIFWNTDWKPVNLSYTLGILCNPGHKALSEFPTDYYSNYQWHDAMLHSGVVRLDSLGYKGVPIVRVIDDWFTSRPIALIVEAKAYKGKLMISGIDFFTDIENRKSGKQLLYSILEYMKSDHFNPSELIDMDKVSKL